MEVIAYPQDERIRLIAPGGEIELRYIDLSIDFKKQYITGLNENKLVLPNEVKNQTDNEIFNDKFYAGNIKHIKYFIGILYLQECLKLSTASRSENDLYMAIIGNIYYPSFRGNIIIKTHTLGLLSKRKYESIESMKYLELLSRAYFIIEENTRFDIYDDFTEKTLFERSNLSLFDTCSNYLIKKSTHPHLKKHVTLVYNSERGRFFLLKYDYKNAIPNLLVAHSSAPENIKLRSMLVEAIYEKFQASEGEDTAGFMNYVVEDSFLLDDPKFRQLYCFFR